MLCSWHLWNQRILYLQSSGNLYLSSWFPHKGPRRRILNASSQLVHLSHSYFYGNDLVGYSTGRSLEECKKYCMDDSECAGFSYVMNGKGICNPKNQLLNGYQSPGVINDMYIRVSIKDSSVLNSTAITETPADCSSSKTLVTENFKTSKKSRSIIKYPLGFVVAFGVFEIVCITLG